MSMDDSPRSLCWFPMIPNNEFFGPQICIQSFDITKWSRKTIPDSEAIVCPGNQQMLAGGLIYEAIHSVAGPELRDAVLAIPEVQPGIRCPVGEAKITPGYKLPAKYVIHVVEPMYGPDVSPEQALRTVYCVSNLFIPRQSEEHSTIFVPVFLLKKLSPWLIPLFFTADFEQVHFVISSDDVYRVWSDKGHQMFLHCKRL